MLVNESKYRHLYKTPLNEGREFLLAHNYFLNEKLVETLLQYHKCAVILGTGGGKSYNVAQVIYDFAKDKHVKSNPKVAIIGMSNSLEEQWEELAKQIGADNGEPDELVTESKKGNLRGSKLDDAITVEFSYDFFTYSKLSQKSSSIISKLSGYDLVVLDEMHHIEADTYSDPVSLLINTTVKNNNYIIGLTATPLRDDERNILSAFDNHVVKGLSIAEGSGLPDKDGYKQYSVETETGTTKFKTKNGLYPILNIVKIPLLDYKPGDKYLSLVDRLEKIKNYKSKDSTARDCAFYALRGIKNYFTNDSIKDLVQSKVQSPQKLIVYAGENLKQVEEYVRTFFGINKIVYKYAEAKGEESRDSENAEADRIFRASKGEDIAIINKFMLTEGVHVSGVNEIAIFRTVKTQNEYAQMVGRLMRIGSDIKNVVAFDFLMNADLITTSSWNSMESGNSSAVDKSIFSMIQKSNDKDIPAEMKDTISYIVQAFQYAPKSLIK